MLTGVPLYFLFLKEPCERYSQVSFSIYRSTCSKTLTLPKFPDRNIRIFSASVQLGVSASNPAISVSTHHEALFPIYSVANTSPNNSNTSQI